MVIAIKLSNVKILWTLNPNPKFVFDDSVWNINYVRMRRKIIDDFRL